MTPELDRYYSERFSMMASDEIGIGWTWDGSNWSAPVIPEPPAE